MTRILITGLKEPTGGIENIVMAYVRHFSSEAITADFAVFGAKLSFENEITKRNGRVFYMPDRKSEYRKYKKALHKIFTENKYDVVWCNFSGLTNIDFLKDAKKAGVPIRVAHAHTSGYFWGSPLMKYIVPVLHNINKVILPLYANRFWTCSEKAARFMFSKKYANQIQPVRNAIDTSLFQKNEETGKNVRKEFNIPDASLVVGHVGRMCSAKNQLFLLDIFKSVVCKRPDAKLLFIGDGELHDQIKDYAYESGLENSVIFTGTRKDIPRLLQAFDVFALPSTSEGLPVVLIEAQAADVPCVTSENAVSDEVNVTGTVSFISLNCTADFWAEEIIKQSKQKPSNGTDKLMKNGYDIKTEAQKLEKRFLESNK